MFSCPILVTRPAHPGGFSCFLGMFSISPILTTCLSSLFGPFGQTSLVAQQLPPTVCKAGPAGPRPVLVRHPGNILSTLKMAKRPAPAYHHYWTTTMPITSGPPQCPSSLLDHHNAHHHCWTTTTPIIIDRPAPAYDHCHHWTTPLPIITNGPPSCPPHVYTTGPPMPAGRHHYSSYLYA